MKNPNKSALNLTGLLALSLSNSVFAHVNVAPEAAFTVGEEPREYLEGSRAYINLNLPEDCASEDGSKRFAITSTVMILPNGSGLSEDFYTTGHGSDEQFTANIMMRTKPRLNANWGQIGAETGGVTPYGSRAKTVDTRALKWLKGHIKTTQTYDNSEFVTSLPKIKSESCVNKVRVEIPTITYCTGGYSRAWIGTAGSQFQPSPKTVVEDSYEPYFYIVRKAENPLSDTCGEGEEITVRPSDGDINQYSGDWLQRPSDHPYDDK